MNEEMILEALERLKSKYYGKYRGTVTEVDEATMRVKAKAPAALGDQATGWARPCVPYAGDGVGFAFLPEVGSGVWIEFEGGDVSLPVWTGCYWRDGEAPKDAKAQVKVIATVKHKIILDDSTPKIVISDEAGNKITLDSDGVLVERDGKKVLVSSSKVDVNGGALEVL